MISKEESSKGQVKSSKNEFYFICNQPLPTSTNITPYRTVFRSQQERIPKTLLQTQEFSIPATSHLDYPLPTTLSPPLPDPNNFYQSKLSPTSPKKFPPVLPLISTALGAQFDLLKPILA